MEVFMKKRLLATILLVCSSFALFAAGNAESSSGAGKAGKEVLRFMWWGGDARHQATLKVIKQFMDANPGVTIDAEYGGMDGYYQKLTTQISSGTEPDIIQIIPEWFKPLGKSGDVFIPLDENPDFFDVSGFSQTFLASSCTIKGHVQGVPTGSNGSCLVINKNFMKRFGIPEDTKWTWDLIEKYGEEIHKKDSSCYLLGSNSTKTPVGHLLKFYLMQLPNVTGYVNEDYTIGFTAADVKKALDYFIHLEAIGAIQPYAETSLYKTPIENATWVEGNVGMMDGMPSTLATYKCDAVDLDVAEIPQAEGASDSGCLTGPPQFLVISKNSKHQQTALKFLNYFFNDSVAIETLGTTRGLQPTKGGMKVLIDKGIVTDLDQKAQQMVTNAASKRFNLLWLLNDFETPYADACNAAILKTLTTEQAAEKMVKDFQESCARLKANNT